MTVIKGPFLILERRVNAPNVLSYLNCWSRLFLRARWTVVLLVLVSKVLPKKTWYLYLFWRLHEKKPESIEFESWKFAWCLFRATCLITLTVALFHPARAVRVLAGCHQWVTFYCYYYWHAPGFAQVGLKFVTPKPVKVELGRLIWQCSSCSLYLLSYKFILDSVLCLLWCIVFVLFVSDWVLAPSY